MKILAYSPSLAITNSCTKIVFSENVDSFRKCIFPQTKQTPTPRKITLCSKKPHIHNDLNQMKQPMPTSEQARSSGCAAPAGLVFDVGLTGSWDSFEVGSPVVKRFMSDDEERWYMWYHGRSEKNPGSDSIGLAISSNGVHWRREEEFVMKCGGDWWSFDTVSVRPSEVMIMSSSKVRGSSAVYWLYYTGYSSEEIRNGGDLGVGRFFKSLPGLAMSQDGRNWARIEGDHHSGGLFDSGSNGEWDSLFISSPHVVSHSKGDLRMYYHSFDQQNEKYTIGMATSKDGIKWMKLGKILEGSSDNECFDAMGVMNPCVVKDKKDGYYLMVYEGVGIDGRTSIGLAISSDGLKDWRRVVEGAILMPSEEEDGWDKKGVGCPCLVEMEGDEDRWRLYYTGVGEDDRTGIGLAVSQGSDIKCFRRWTGFSL